MPMSQWLPGRLPGTKDRTKRLIVMSGTDTSPTIRNFKKHEAPGTPVEIEIRCKTTGLFLSAKTRVYDNVNSKGTINGDAYLAGAPPLSSIGPGPYEFRWQKIVETELSPELQMEHDQSPVERAAAVIADAENAAYNQGFDNGRIAGLRQALAKAEEHAENLRRLLNVAGG